MHGKNALAGGGPHRRKHRMVTWPSTAPPKSRLHQRPRALPARKYCRCRAENNRLKLNTRCDAPRRPSQAPSSNFTKPPNPSSPGAAASHTGAVIGRLRSWWPETAADFLLMQQQIANAAALECCVSRETLTLPSSATFERNPIRRGKARAAQRAHTPSRIPHPSVVHSNCATSPRQMCARCFCKPR